jgi:hypothetical protein
MGQRRPLLRLQQRPQRSLQNAGTPPRRPFLGVPHLNCCPSWTHPPHRSSSPPSPISPRLHTQIRSQGAARRIKADGSRAAADRGPQLELRGRQIEAAADRGRLLELHPRLAVDACSSSTISDVLLHPCLVVDAARLRPRLAVGVAPTRQRLAVNVWPEAEDPKPEAEDPVRWSSCQSRGSTATATCSSSRGRLLPSAAPPPRVFRGGLHGAARLPKCSVRRVDLQAAASSSSPGEHRRPAPQGCRVGILSSSPTLLLLLPPRTSFPAHAGARRTFCRGRRDSLRTREPTAREDAAAAARRLLEALLPSSACIFSLFSSSGDVDGETAGDGLSLPICVRVWCWVCVSSGNTTCILINQAI